MSQSPSLTEQGDERANIILLVPTQTQIDSFESERKSTKYPFSSRDSRFADMTLVTSDKVEMQTCQMILAFASPIFRDMFLLPQPPADNDDDSPTTDSGSHPSPAPSPPAVPAPTRPHVPPPPKASSASRVHLVESAIIWDRVLRWCDPSLAPYTSSLDDISLIIDTVKKYYMSGIKIRICRFLAHSLLAPSADVMRIWAIAMRIGEDKPLIRNAAIHSLRIMIRERKGNPDLEFIPAGSYQRLQEFYIACGDAASELTNNYAQNEKLSTFMGENTNWKSTGPEWEKQHSCSTNRRSSPVWLQAYMAAAAKKLQERPGGATVEGIPEFFYEHAVSAIKCSACNSRNRFLVSLESFNRVLADEIDAVIGLVPIPTV